MWILFIYLFGTFVFVCVFVSFKKFIPLEKYVLIKLFILTNYDVFHGLDHPALLLPNMRVQSRSRCNGIDSVSATTGVELTQ